eukprot:761671-Prorocentrum_minimum.AAC.1
MSCWHVRLAPALSGCPVDARDWLPPQADAPSPRSIGCRRPSQWFAALIERRRQHVIGSRRHNQKCRRLCVRWRRLERSVD